MYPPVLEKELILFKSSKIRNKFKHRKAQFHKKSYSVVIKLNRIFALHFFANDLYQAGTLRQSDVLMKSLRRHNGVSA